MTEEGLEEKLSRVGETLMDTPVCHSGNTEEVKKWAEDALESVDSALSDFPNLKEEFRYRLEKSRKKIEIIYNESFDVAGYVEDITTLIREAISAIREAEAERIDS